MFARDFYRMQFQARWERSVNVTPFADAPRINTFRDPAGSLYFENGKVLRSVRAEFEAFVLEFITSDFAHNWVSSGQLIPTEVLGRRADGSLLLEHPLISFPSYPWEWTSGQWNAAAELTLQLCEGLLEIGLILKDATPMNIMFDGPNPIFVDLLSVERRDPSNPIWNAYAQFVRTFLLPLAAKEHLGWPLAASISQIG